MHKKQESFKPVVQKRLSGAFFADAELSGNAEH
jgi:hypothetical protein